MNFAASVVAWQKQHGRHGLPWQAGGAYRVWLSEVMLQQTQVATVLPYFLRFVERFPSVEVLAAAQEEDVLALWAGLGYYRRARHLHAAARIVAKDYGGRFPENAKALQALPGVGRSTAGAIRSLGQGKPAAILDGNVRRLFCRHFGIDGCPTNSTVARELWRLAEALLPQSDAAAYTQGLMDLGATVCLPRRAECAVCPLAATCRALEEKRVASLPAPCPKKTLPVRRKVLLLIRYRDSIFLERRPPTGIWPGLWSLPELELEDEPVTAGRLRYGLSLWPDDPLPTFRHRFTHYCLEAIPLPCTAAGLAAAEGAWGFYSLAASLPPLPTPIARLLKE